MTQEEKQLLLIDLCARLPYEVPIIPNGQVTPHKIVDIDFNKEVVIVQPINRELMGVGCLGFEDFKMILRPMSSMTEEEKETHECFFNEDGLINCSVYVYVDWLLEHHFDYRGLIPMGLGIDCTRLNIYENEKSI